MSEPADLTDDLIAICRLFAVVEKEQVCCGTVTVAQCVVLQSLLRSDSEAAKLAAEHGVSRSAMTRLVDGLEKRGWVVRTRDAADRRHVSIELSEAGRAEAERLRELTRQSMNVAIKRLPEAARSQVRESVHLVRTILEDCRDQLTCG